MRRAGGATWWATLKCHGVRAFRHARSGRVDLDRGASVVPGEGDPCTGTGRKRQGFAAQNAGQRLCHCGRGAGGDGNAKQCHAASQSAGITGAAAINVRV